MSAQVSVGSWVVKASSGNRGAVTLTVGEVTKFVTSSKKQSVWDDLLKGYVKENAEVQRVVVRVYKRFSNSGKELRVDRKTQTYDADSVFCVDSLIPDEARDTDPAPPPPPDVPTQKMDESAFEYSENEELAWRVTEHVKWDDVVKRAKETNGKINFDAIQRSVLKTFGSFGAKAHTGIGELVFRLHKALTKSRLDDAIDLGDDSYSDFSNHVVGMGRKFYERHLQNPLLLVELANSGNFYESFAYAVPFGQSDMLNDEFVRDRADMLIAEVTAIKDAAATNMHKYYVLRTLQSFAVTPIDDNEFVYKTADVVRNKAQFDVSIKALKPVWKEYFVAENFFNDLVNWRGPLKSRDEWVSAQK